MIVILHVYPSSLFFSMDTVSGTLASFHVISAGHRAEKQIFAPLYSRLCFIVGDTYLMAKRRRGGGVGVSLTVCVLCILGGSLTKALRENV